MHQLNYFKDTIGKFLSQRCISSPIFIIGCGRSGTSVLLQALGKHPSIIALLGEAPLITSIGGNASLFFSDKAEYYRSSLKMNLDHLFEDLSKLGLEIAGGEHYALNNFLKALRVGEYKRKKYWSAKTFPTENVEKGLLAVYPNARFIYIARNGIDVVHSMTKYHGFRDQEFTKNCQVWSDSVEKYRYLTQYENALFLKHEDLISNPDDFFVSIFTYLNLNFSQKSIDFIKNNIVHPLDQPSQNEQDAITQLKNRKSPFNTWTTEQQQTFISICSEAMNELQYSTPNLH